VIPPALSLHRPWSELILRCGKNIENRSWRTAYRGPLLIHSAKPWSGDALDFAQDVELALDRDLGVSRLPRHDDAPTGIVGVVDLVDVCDVGVYPRLRGDQCGLWAMPDQYHWQLANPRPFAEPIPCPGRQQLWTPPADLEALLCRQLNDVDADLLAALRAAATAVDPPPAGLADRAAALLRAVRKGKGNG
jgi:hypothetical protein